MEQRTTISFEKQEAIVSSCVRDNLKLSDVLKSYGYTYDDLRYRHNKAMSSINMPYQTIEDYRDRYHGVPAVSFFSGAGGLDLAFEGAGFQHLASFEINELFCDTLRLNRPNWNIFGPPETTGDIREREKIAAILTEQIGIDAPFNGVFHGGPPCQPFSIAANQRFAKWGNNFKRIGYAHEEKGNLLFDYIWQIQTFKPAVFLIENVVGLMTIDGGGQLFEAIKSLRECGYEVAKPTVLNARHYGVPQSRERLFIVGWRNQERNFTFPTEDHTEVPCHVALSDIETLPNHVTRKHEAESIIRYMELQYGQRDELGRVDRLDPNLPSKTVIAGGTKGGGRSHLHPIIPRTLSPRESARLQTFPDNYIFCGPPARQLTQVGNAVPPMLGKAIASAIYKSFFE